MVYRRTERTEQRLANRRNAILRAVHDVVSEIGFRDLQMQTIAAAADVAIGTVYRYFPSKADLCSELVASVSEREVNIARAVAAGEGDPVNRLWDLVCTFSRRAIRGRILAYAVIAEPVEAAVDRTRLKYRQELAGVISELIDEGIRNRHLPEQDAEASAACIAGAFMESLVGPLAPDSRIIEDEGRDLVEEIALFCLRGVGSNKELGTITELSAKRAQVRNGIQT